MAEMATYVLFTVHTDTDTDDDDDDDDDDTLIFYSIDIAHSSSDVQTVGLFSFCLTFGFTCLYSVISCVSPLLSFIIMFFSGYFLLGSSAP